MSFKLGRSAPLKRVPLRRRPKRRVETPAEREARMAWKEPRQGKCTCGCQPATVVMHLERHHVVTASKLREIGREDEMWNLANSMLLAPTHHARHTSHFSCIKIEYVPVAALAFAVDVLGEGGAAAYLRAHYDCTVTA